MKVRASQEKFLGRITADFFGNSGITWDELTDTWDSYTNTWDSFAADTEIGSLMKVSAQSESPQKVTII